MEKYNKLAELAEKIPGNVGKNAVALVARMREVIEGVGDKPLEWKPHTIKLVQATTDRSKLPRGASIGSLVLGEELVKTPLKVIPQRLFTTRQMWSEDLSSATMQCSSPDGIVGFRYGKCKDCPNSKFDEDLKKSLCNKTISVLSVTEDLTHIFYTNFTKTNYSNGMDWQSMMKKAGVSPYKRVYEMSSGQSPKVKNVEVIKIEPVSPDNTVDEKILPFVTELFNLAGEDRARQLEHFYEYVNNRAASTESLLGNMDSGVTLITAETEKQSTSEEKGYTL